MAVAPAVDAGTVDPVTFEILSHRLHQITREMGATLERVGGTVNTTQMKDYMSALYRANGDILSAGETTGQHVACASVAVKRIIQRFADDDGIDPGDVFLLNDPYVAAIHQSDVYLICPIHDGDRLVAWSATFVHVMDIGAMSPGGNSPGATEICHEGVRIPGIKLMERGKLRRDVFEAITNMTRQPGMVGLDLKCEIAANNVARARMQEMYAQYGADLLDAVSAEMIRYSEMVLRRRLRQIPDGVWHAKGIVETTDTWNVVLTLTKREDRLLFDFTGTDPQAKVGINLPFHATIGNCFAGVLSLLGWDIPKNHGAMAPIEVIAPPGTIMNPTHPAPVSLATTSGGAMARFLADSVLTQMAASSDQWRGEAMAKHAGGRRARHAGVNQYGNYYVSTFGGVRGGGGHADGDGVDSTGQGTTTIHNVEWVESSFPLLYLFRRHTRDGAGAGRHRGGAGEEVGITVHNAPEGRIRGVAYGVAGFKNSGQGLFGGYPAPPSVLTLYRGTEVQDRLASDQMPQDLEALGGESELLGYCDFTMGSSDVLFLRSASGGGYGDPLDRDPTAVLEDVQQGLITEEMALTVYGVAVAADGIDAAATERHRAGLWEERRRAGRSQTAGPDLSDAQVLHPLRENLEVARLGGETWVRCARCTHGLTRQDADWTQACARLTLAPERASPVMAPWNDHARLLQLCCPACGALFDCDLVEAADR
jgi:N-methylhydantoinase B